MNKCEEATKRGKKIFTYFLFFLKKENISYYEWIAHPLVDQAAQPAFLKFPRQKSPQPARCVGTRREERCAEMVLWFYRGPRYAVRLQWARWGRWKRKGFRAKVWTSHTSTGVPFRHDQSHSVAIRDGSTRLHNVSDWRYLYWRKWNWNMGHCVSPLSSASFSHFLCSSCGWCAQTLNELQTRLRAATVTTLWRHSRHLEPSVATEEDNIFFFFKNPVSY